MFAKLVLARYLLALACGLFIASSAHAQISCLLSSFPANFGLIDAPDTPLDNSGGSISITCDALGPSYPPGGVVNYSITLNPGLSGSYLRRQMRFGTSVLYYNLYISGSYGAASIWGDGSQGTTFLAGAIGQLNTLNARRSSPDHIVYGRIEGNQAPKPGMHSDTLVVTVNLDF